MPEEQVDYASAFFSDINTKLMDMEEKQRLLKERVLLIGQNLVETKELLDTDLAKLKSSNEEIKQDMKKIKEMLLRIAEELEKKARKSELELLQKQAKMFQPLEFMRK